MLAATLYHESMPLFSHPLWTACCTSVGLKIYTREHISRFCQNCHFLPFKCIKIVLNHNLDILYEYQYYGLIQKAWMILQFQREIKIQKIKKKLHWFISKSPTSYMYITIFISKHFSWGAFRNHKAKSLTTWKVSLLHFLY